MFAQTKMEALYTLTLFLDHFTFTQMQSKGIFFLQYWTGSRHFEVILFH